MSTYDFEPDPSDYGPEPSHIANGQRKNTALTVPSGGNSGGAHTVGEVMELCNSLGDLRVMASRGLCVTWDEVSDANQALLVAITKLVDAHDCDKAILLARIVAMENAQLEMNPDWDVKSACMESVREHMEIAKDLREKLERVESDRDVLLSAMREIEHHYDTEVVLSRDVARAAIQKVTA
jgi:hypothetical protein